MNKGLFLTLSRRAWMLLAKISATSGATYCLDASARLGGLDSLLFYALVPCP
jgi:hypothetical protein